MCQCLQNNPSTAATIVSLLPVMARPNCIEQPYFHLEGPIQHSGIALPSEDDELASRTDWLFAYRKMMITGPFIILLLYHAFISICYYYISYDDQHIAIIDPKLQKFKMKKLINPTTYFFEQAQQTPSDPSPEIEQFVSKLINKDQCELCRNQYDTLIHIPRILIHCGHTFCQPCIKEFFRKDRVRCPMCLKLVKKLNAIQRLPINHTIYKHLALKQALQNPVPVTKPAVTVPVREQSKAGQQLKQKQGEKKIRVSILDQSSRQVILEQASKFLYSQFERTQKQALKQQNPLKYDDQSGLPFCVFHNDRVEHFYCEAHKSFGCRVCIQIGHSKGQCHVVDLYTVEDPAKYQSIMDNKIQDNYPVGCFNPSAYNMDKYGGFGNGYKNMEGTATYANNYMEFGSHPSSNMNMNMNMNMQMIKNKKMNGNYVDAQFPENGNANMNMNMGNMKNGKGFGFNNILDYEQQDNNEANKSF